jgi:hypothetical protein
MTTNEKPPFSWCWQAPQVIAIHDERTGEIAAELDDRHADKPRSNEAMELQARLMTNALNASDDGTDARMGAIREMARAQRHRDGEVEIDENAVVSEGDDNGAYVQAWVWVDFSGTPLDKDLPTRAKLGE